MVHATTVVFIPALLCDEALYTDVIDQLGDTIEAHVMLSPKPNIADSVTDILARAPATFALVGTSYGGRLALEIALAAPSRVTALWLMGCTADGPSEGGPDLAGGLDNDPEAVIEMLAGLVVHSDATVEADIFRSMAQRVGGPAGAAQARALANRADLSDRLDTLTMPALLLWGADDALVPAAVGKALSRAMPHAHFHSLTGCGHLPTLEKPTEAATLFAEFLAGETHHHH